jgi:glycosyltransferase involved in cell wall biosynthesis
MRICFISNLYPPYARGGAERVVSEEAAALRALGHDVSVITSAPVADDGDASLKTTVEDGIRVHRFYPMNLFFYGDIGRHGAFARTVWHAWDTVNPYAASVVSKILAKERPEVVHTHNLKGLGLSIPGAIRRLKLRHVHTLHDVQLVVPSGLLMKGGERAVLASTTSRAYVTAMKRVYGSPEMVISPSSFLMRFYEERGFFPRSERIILPNPAPSPGPVERQPSSETRFLFFGQVEKHKGVLALIEAMKALFKKHPKARLDVVGVGAALDEAVRAAGKDRRFAFHGKKHPAQFARMFADADFTVVPSLCYENAPTVILESFAYGVPVIVADIGGAAELVRDGKNGLVFKAGDRAALSAALERAIDGRKDKAELSRRARDTARSLSIADHVERLERLYLERDPALEHAGPVVPIRYLPKS